MPDSDFQAVTVDRVTPLLRQLEDMRTAGCVMWNDFFKPTTRYLTASSEGAPAEILVAIRYIPDDAECRLVRPADLREALAVWRQRPDILGNGNLSVAVYGENIGGIKGDSNIFHPVFWSRQPPALELSLSRLDGWWDDPYTLYVRR